MNQKGWDQQFWWVMVCAGLGFTVCGCFFTPLIHLPFYGETKFSSPALGLHGGGSGRAWVANLAMAAGIALGLLTRNRWLSGGLYLGGWATLTLAMINIVMYFADCASQGEQLELNILKSVKAGGWCLLIAIPVTLCCYLLGWDRISLRKSPSKRIELTSS